MIIALKTIREAKGISADDLAERTGLTKMKIWNYESGRNQPDPETLCKLADVLDVSLDMLVRGKEDVLEKHNVAWKAIHEDYETLTASGRLKVNLMLSIAQDEADRTSERVKAVFQRKREEEFQYNKMGILSL